MDKEVKVSARSVSLAGNLTVPAQATGSVVFAHGSGSSRHSPRNRHVWTSWLTMRMLASCWMPSSSPPAPAR